MADSKHKKADTSANYVPALKSGNPVKNSRDDWWDDLCSKHNAKNYWKKEEKKKQKNEDKQKKGTKFFNSLGKTKKQN